MNGLLRGFAWLGLSALIGPGFAASAHADPIRPWAGASAVASEGVLNRTASGSTASAMVNGLLPVHFHGSFDPDTRVYKADFPRSAEAHAHGDPSRLLTLRTELVQPNLGTRPALLGSAPPPHAEARWTGDVIQIVPTAGSPLPDSVELEVALQVSLPEAWAQKGLHIPYGEIAMAYQGRELRFPHGPSSVGQYSTQDWARHFEDSGLNDVSIDVGSPRAESIVARGSVMLELAIDESGRSDPFDLSISSTPYSYTFSNLGYTTIHDLTLSLADITLPDGRSVTDAGYTVTFDSGLPWPAPVPEPGSVAVWAALAAAGMGLAAHRRRRVG